MSVVVFLVFCSFNLAFGSSSYTLTQSDKDQILNLHNQIRTTFGLTQLVWDSTLESSSKTYCAQCVWAHSVTSTSTYGENLAMNAKSPVTVFPMSSWKDQINGWYTEWQSWDCPTNACSGVCGHLTQIVWKDTTAVGCGVARCDPGTVSSMESQYLVCQYTKRGNFVGKHPLTLLSGGFTGCPAKPLPALMDPTIPPPPPPSNPSPVAPPLGTPNPTAPANPPATPTAPPTAPPTTPPPSSTSYGGCIGDYWPPATPKVQKLTPCKAIPKTFTDTRTGAKKLYCNVGDPQNYLWPVINPNTPECIYVAKLTADSDSTEPAPLLPMEAWVGIAIGIAVFIIIVIVVVIIVKNKKPDERV
jgi:pathogenesis-related protein 1